MQVTDSNWLTEKFEGRYRILREIGRGGWGVVYLADDLRHGRRVAIKLLINSDSTTGLDARFRQEIAAEAQLQHPYIVPVHDSGEIEGTLYFVMAFIEGGSLAERISRDRRLPVRDALRIATQVAEALAHAHERNIIHRDIKPANVLLGDGLARVADFGIARHMTATTDGGRLTQEGMRLGTPAYMAPEQAADAALVDARSDIYSLGCVLFEMLTGHPPYRARTLQGLFVKHAADPVPSARAAREEISEELDAVLRRALAKAPDDRFSQAIEMRDALEALLAEHPSGAHRRARRLPQVRTRLLIGMAAVAVLAAISGRPTWRALANTTPADTTRLLVLPLVGSGDAVPVGDETIRRALSHWQGLALVDPTAVRTRVGTKTLTPRLAASTARQFGAARYLRADVSLDGGAPNLRVALYDAANAGLPLAEASARLPAENDAQDSVVSDLIQRLLLRSAPIPGVSTPTGTRSLAAAQEFLAGRQYVHRWVLDSAEAAFDRSWRLDEAFGEAALWLAMTRYWQLGTPASWKSAVLAALADSSRLESRSRSAASALQAIADGDPAEGCRRWESLTSRTPFDFWTWYSAGVCFDEDRVVMPDLRSPSGWRFRSSYHQAQQRYLRAFQLAPNAHRALRGDAFDRVRFLLYINPNLRRRGATADGTRRFSARPELVGDSLAFVPYPEVAVAAMATSGSGPSAWNITLRRQREHFRELATAWATADPGSPSAQEALALALQLLADPAALDTIARALRQAPNREERAHVSATAAWIRIRFALPDDHATLRSTHALADSVLALPATEENLRAQASLAALTGRVTRVLAVAKRQRRPDARFLGVEGAHDASELLLRSAFGVADSAIPKLARRLDSIIVASIAPADRQRSMMLAFSRAGPLAWPNYRLAAIADPALDQDYLVAAVQASVLGDSAELASRLSAIRAARALTPPTAVSFDALVTECTLLARHGFASIATSWLDEALTAQRTAAPEFDPVNAASFVRAMALRAQLAADADDPATARRWAAAVLALWSNADATLKPVLDKMRALAR